MRALQAKFFFLFRGFRQDSRASGNWHRSVHSRAAGFREAAYTKVGPAVILSVPHCWGLGSAKEHLSGAPRHCPCTDPSAAQALGLRGWGEPCVGALGAGGDVVTH